MKILSHVTDCLRLAILVVFFCGGTYTLNAQLTIKGHVFDKKTKEPVAFANILIVNSAIGTTTDEQGRFELYLSSTSELRISHLNYEEKQLRVLVQPGTKELKIGLKQRAIIMEEIVVTGQAKKKDIIQVETSSIVDFIPVDSLFLVIDTESTFKGNRLSLISAAGDPIVSVTPPRGKNIWKLVKSCTGIIYALSDFYAYPINIFGHQIDLMDRLAIDTYETFIRPCKVKHKNSLYYLTPMKNGLINLLKHYNVSSGEINLMAIVEDAELSAAYDNDVGQIQRGRDVNTILTNSYDINRHLRNLQRNANFLRDFFYKPKYPNFVFTNDSLIYLMDHFNEKIVTYRDTQLISTVDIQYMGKPKWEEIILKDPVTQKLYGVFREKGKFKLYRINPKTGTAKFNTELKCPVEFIRSLQIHNNNVYYLEDNYQGKRRLRYQEIF